MDVSIVGSGYVGTTVAACFADLGHDVVNVDVDEDVVASINDGNAPIHEPGLAELVEENAGDGLRATTEYSAVRDTDVTFLALPTPSRDDGSIDRSAIRAGAESLATALSSKTEGHTVVVKSTVVPGTTEEVVGTALEAVEGNTLGENVGIGMNPEFLREGSAVEDFLDPDKVVLGWETDWVGEAMRAVFDPLVDRADPVVVDTGIREAEFIKYANNAFLASKVSLINELGNIAKEFGVDSYEVADAIGLDHRISEHFLRSGVGWGGSCFPKDVDALRAAAREVGYEPELLDAVVAVNDEQPERMLALLERHVDVDDTTIAVLGLSFKPHTDDIRNSRAIPIIRGLTERGATVWAYDPVAAEEMREVFPGVSYAASAAGALDGADGALVVTDWPEFEDLDEEFDAMRTPVVVDGRRVVDRRDGLIYEGLTW
ncbi:UDP-glucose 6-dehydrogenase AglM [Halanaeroarchaeum sulfurireducens]|uniref:UDP-glucose 6-dehydrogenase n=1 Tax=Halanaeroarchaeum sulfurireducens TaxID=1604004 RepID=A0A0F7PBG6_9EURY|nr:UDP-glucose 6-dehydrogenase AglM [Halanaeroarchaeum sulfurireducens]AKH98032.1 UDP-glucose 6-dehydrogenase [Halanaeroarchaeum sulfurireducens]ALG82426.1 UDP-glucose 6-dehydrogenase [Halanaeroarchaeum sulfurireducens]